MKKESKSATASGQANTQTASRRDGESASDKLNEMGSKPKLSKPVSNPRESIYHGRY